MSKNPSHSYILEHRKRDPVISPRIFLLTVKTSLCTKYTIYLIFQQNFKKNWILFTNYMYETSNSGKRNLAIHIRWSENFAGFIHSFTRIYWVRDIFGDEIVYPNVIHVHIFPSWPEKRGPL